MEILIVAAIVSLVLSMATFRVVVDVVGRAVDNLIDWAIYNFGNEDAVRRLKEKHR